MYKHTPQKPEIIAEDLNIVMNGEFNPQIFQPYWFSSQELIRDSEAAAASVELVHSDFTSFSTDWFVLQVARERFNLAIKSSAYKKHLADLAQGTFQKLSHTPVRQMGLNYGLTLKFRNENDWHAFGHFLVPKSAYQGLFDRPGVVNAAVNGRRDDDLPGFIQLSIEPALSTHSDVTVRINNHYERNHDDKNNGPEFFVSLIETQFDKVISESHQRIEKLLDRFVNQRDFDNGMNS